jgi:hypothetical protein
MQSTVLFSVFNFVFLDLMAFSYNNCYFELTILKYHHAIHIIEILIIF